MFSPLIFLVPILPVALLCLPCLFWSHREIGRRIDCGRRLETPDETLLSRAGRLGFRQMFLYLGLIATMVLTLEVLRPEVLEGMGYLWLFASIPSAIAACFLARSWARSRTRLRLQAATT